MSIFSSPQSRLHAIHDLLKLIDLSGGKATIDKLRQWMQPPSKGPAAFDANVAAARSLSLIETSSRELHLTTPVPATLGEFSDIVHQRFIDDSATTNSRLLDGLAVCIALSQKHGALSALSAKAKDDLLNLIGYYTKLNSEQLGTWQPWLIGLGLGWELPGYYFLPSITDRLDRTLLTHPSFERGVEYPAHEFLSKLQQAMPYIDGGVRHAKACSTIQWHPDRSLSPVLSLALDAMLETKRCAFTRTGDAAHLELFPGSKLESFSHVRINE